MTSALSMPSFQNYYGSVAIEANDGTYFFGDETQANPSAIEAISHPIEAQ